MMIIKNHKLVISYDSYDDHKNHKLVINYDSYDDHKNHKLCKFNV